MYPIPGVVGVGVGARGIAWRHGVGKRWSSGDGTWGDGSSGSGRARDRAGASIEPWVCVGGRLWGGARATGGAAAGAAAGGD